MGGTSTDVAMIRDALIPPSANEIEIEYAMPIHVPMVDVRTVGAGGGSIARVDCGGAPAGGPRLGGLDPGANLLRASGGTEPTISDANMLLGRLNPERLNTGAEGGVSLDTIREAFADEARRSRWGSAPARGRGGGAEDRQCQDGRRRAHGVDLAGRGPARLRALRLRRGGTAARLRHRWRANWACRGCWCPRARASPTRSAASWPTCATISRGHRGQQAARQPVTWTRWPTR